MYIIGFHKKAEKVKLLCDILSKKEGKYWKFGGNQTGKNRHRQCYDSGTSQ